MPATIGGQILIGQVMKVFTHYSLVRTVFSPDWQLPVRIGPKKIPGLLMGGPAVRVSMIESGKTIRVGDAVSAAGREVPFGLKIGVVDAVRADTAAGVFQEATILFSYALTDLTELTLLTWTPE
jgi:cell shape-determining protein MreC